MGDGKTKDSELNYSKHYPNRDETGTLLQFSQTASMGFHRSSRIITNETVKVGCTICFITWITVILDKRAVTQQVKQLPGFYGTGKLIASFTRPCQGTLS
jgi:hypothetical protein